MIRSHLSRIRYGVLLAAAAFILVGRSETRLKAAMDDPFCADACGPTADCDLRCLGSGDPYGIFRCGTWGGGAPDECYEPYCGDGVCNAGANPVRTTAAIALRTSVATTLATGGTAKAGETVPTTAIHRT